MHDIGHTPPGYENEYNEFELDNGEFEMDEFEAGEFGDGEYESEYDEFEEEYDEYEGEGILSEAEEMELVYELINVSSDEELEQFLGKFFKKIGRKVKKFGRKFLKPVGRVLKGVAKKALPWVGKAVGTYFGGPAGAAVGGKLGSLVGSKLEMELIGMNEEEREFELARRFVRTVNVAAKRAVKAPSGANPNLVAKKAVGSAVKKYLPYNVKVKSNLSKRRAGRSGRWVRQGNKIVILGA
ncbi:MAG: hypothetical protein D3924_08020 [Candidatus Electrothrix sp. AR4]|nr:hypothetical protein [Candidatus Electrothrix sp. AR4]